MYGLEQRDDVVLRLRSARQPWWGPIPAFVLMLAAIAAFEAFTKPAPGHTRGIALELALPFTLAVGAAVLTLLSATPIRGDHVDVSPKGIWPSSRARLFVPAAAIEAVEVRSWYLQSLWQRFGRTTENASLLLTDGRRVILPAVERRKRGNTSVGYARTGADGWRILTDEHGQPVEWIEGKGAAAVAFHLQNLLVDVLAPVTETPEAAQALKLGGLGNDRRGLAWLLRSYRRSARAGVTQTPFQWRQA